MGDQVKLTWEEYCRQFPQPFDISAPFAFRDDPQYDEKRKANMKWQADFYLKGYSAEGPSNFSLLNPYIAGGWYYGVNGPEWIPSPNPQPEVDWAAEAAAGRPVIGPAVPAAARTAAPRQKRSWLKRIFGG